MFTRLKCCSLLQYPFHLAHATLTFETQLVGLEKDSTNGPFNIGKFLNFAIWPGMIVGVLFFLYKRMTAAEEKIKSEKSEKKMRKKKR